MFYFQYIFTKHRAEINKSQLHSILIALHLLDCFPYFLQVLDETNNNNLLVQSCRIYLNCEYITADFCSLANFGNKVIMPFLNCYVKSSQEELKTILPNYALISGEEVWKLFKIVMLNGLMFK